MTDDGIDINQVDMAELRSHRSSDQFAVVERDEDGNPKISHWLDPGRGVSRAGTGRPGRLPLLIDCSCRHCRKGRMCREMADLFRRGARADGDMIRRLRERP